MSHRPEAHPEAFQPLEAFLKSSHMSHAAKAAFRAYILKGNNAAAAEIVPEDEQPEYRAAMEAAYRARCGKAKFAVVNYMPTQGQCQPTVIFHNRI